MSNDVQSLATRAKKGDRGAVSALLERHLDTVYRFVGVKVGPRDPAVDDIVQETLIGASHSMRSMRAESDAQVAGWLLSIARHKVADHLRRRINARHEPLSVTLTDGSPGVEERVFQQERAERLRRMLGELTPEQEEVLILRFVLGFGIAEVAEITRRPEGAVKSMQHRALTSLQKKLGVQEMTWT